VHYAPGETGIFTLVGKKISALLFVPFVITIALVSGCASSHDGPVVGRADAYNYSPSVMQSGSTQQFWWCTDDYNPANPQQLSDTIFYETINADTGQKSNATLALSETPDTWDSVFTCNPRVIRGSFNNPLGDSQTYTYAMYYVATNDSNGIRNSIGVAFSNDGIAWNKYPSPVIAASTSENYGVGQPSAYNPDGKSDIVLFYEDNNTSTISHVRVTSTDGVHFGSPQILTTNGIDPNNANPSWGDIAYDPLTKEWYAAFNLNIRNPDTTGSVQEHGQYGFQLYSIPNSSLTSGATPWQLLKTFDTNLTGYESTFLPGFLKDEYGNVNVGDYPILQIYPSISNPRPAWNASPEDMGNSANVFQWDIGSAIFDPSQPTVALNRYKNSQTYEVTTGWIDTSANFDLDSALGHLYYGPQKGASQGFYGCKNGDTDYFVSTDYQCGGAHIQGINGYGYSKPVPGLSLVPLYSCSTGTSHLVSHDPACEGNGTGTLLGYALP
jgi:hypothetical protein